MLLGMQGTCSIHALGFADTTWLSSMAQAAQEADHAGLGHALLAAHNKQHR